MSTSAALYTSDSLKSANAPSFSTLQGKLSPGLLHSLREMKLEFMTPVQERVMNELPTIRSDCLVQAKTGTGKTLAFLLPAVQSLLIQSPPKGQVAILIISPTRELTLQIAAEAQRLVKGLKRPIEIHTAFGGTAKASNLAMFKRGDPKILVATPGRLIDYLSEIDVRDRFAGMKTLILDEADRMLDAGFLPDILKVLDALPPKYGPNGGWQGMCFSATVPPRLQPVFSHVLAKDRVSISTLDASEPPTLARVPQYSVIIPNVSGSLNALLALLKFEINAADGNSKVIVFGTTAQLVAFYAKVFEHLLELPIFQLHSRLSQPARTRITDSFKTATSGILFASDVVGRGMDFPDVSLVLQVGLPSDADAYTHRVGRTARAGKDGRAVILLTEVESFFLTENPQLPIKPYPSSTEILRTRDEYVPVITNTLRNIDFDAKCKAYSAYMGFMKGFCKKMKMSSSEMVKMCNQFALEGMVSGEVPPLEAKNIGKMGLRGVPGLHIATPLHFTGSGPPKRSRHDLHLTERRDFSTYVSGSTRPEAAEIKPDRGARGGRRGGRGRGTSRNGRGRGSGQRGDTSQGSLPHGDAR